MASYAEIAAKNSEQTPEEAAAPQLPEIVPNESSTASTGSLIDVDTQSVRTVPSDFMEQDVQTSTQADRISRETQQRTTAQDLTRKAAGRKERAEARARRAEGWVVAKIEALTDEEATGLVYTNIAMVVGLSGFLGYKGWGLHERGLLGWKHAGIGAAVVGTVAVVQGAFYRYFTKARGSSKKA